MINQERFGLRGARRDDVGSEPCQSIGEVDAEGSILSYSHNA